MNSLATMSTRLVMGQVLRVFPDTYTAIVRIFDSAPEMGDQADRTVECGIQVFKSSPNGGGPKSATLPSPRDFVYVDFNKSSEYPQICGYHEVPVPTHADTEYHHKISPFEAYGSNDKNLKGGAFPMRGKAAPDVMPGDTITAGADGNFLGILRGGTNILRSSPLTQIIMTKFNQTMQIVARRLKIHTDFGTIESTSEAGTATLELKGNDSLQKSVGPGQDYDYNIKLGGVNLFSMSLRSAFWMVIDRDGKLRMRLKTAEILLESPPDITILGDSFQEQKGSKELIIGKDSKSTVKGNDTHNVRGKQALGIQGSSTTTIGGRQSTTVQGTKDSVIKGVGLLSVSPYAYKETIGAGDYKLVIGDPTAGGLPSPVLAGKMGSYGVEMIAGDYNASTILGDVSLGTLIGDMNFETLLGKVSIGATVGDVEISAPVGNAVISAGLNATVEATAIANIKGQLIQMEHSLAMLDKGGSTDPVVTALKLYKIIINNVMLVFNTHMHPSPQAPAGLLMTAPPATMMSPFSPTDISNKKVLS